MPHQLTVTELVQLLNSKAISSVELTSHFLQRIKTHSSLNAFINISEESALLDAIAADKHISKGNASPLMGIPMGHKDIFCTKKLPTTCGSKMLANYTSPFDATIVTRLQNTGMICVGKTNMDEFAMGSGNESSAFGPVLNPWDTTRVPGGSSGGSAASVAAGLIPIATGSDTGGSVRQPAAFCNLTGLKPTYGLVSRFGMVAYASSLDQAGPMGQSVSDIALMLQEMAGFDKQDSTSIENPIPNYTKALSAPNKSLTIGLPRCFFSKDVDLSIQKALHEAMRIFENAGMKLVDIDLVHHTLWVPCYYVIACAEASSNLARYDGVRFGHRSKKAQTLESMIINSRSEGFGLEVKRRILTGTHVLSAGFFDAYYLKALKIRRLIQQELKQALQQVDVILGPTTPRPAFKIGETTSNPVQNYLADVFTVSANLSGFPALSIPMGFDNHLPLGMQLIGQPFSETTLFSLAHLYQTITDWHLKKPAPQTSHHQQGEL